MRDGEKRFVFEVALIAKRPHTCTTIQSTVELTSDPVPALNGKTLINGSRIAIPCSWVGPGEPGRVWGGNPIEKGCLASSGCQGQLPQYLSAECVTNTCGNVLSSRMGKSGSKDGPMRTEKWYFCFARVRRSYLLNCPSTSSRARGTQILPSKFL